MLRCLYCKSMKPHHHPHDRKAAEPLPRRLAHELWIKQHMEFYQEYALSGVKPKRLLKSNKST